MVLLIGLSDFLFGRMFSIIVSSFYFDVSLIWRLFKTMPIFPFSWRLANSAVKETRDCPVVSGALTMSCNKQGPLCIIQHNHKKIPFLPSYNRMNPSCFVFGILTRVCTPFHPFLAKLFQWVHCRIRNLDKTKKTPQKLQHIVPVSPVDFNGL